MNNNKLKEEFISSFGVEKWEQEEMLGKIFPAHQKLCKYLGVEMLPVICEDIPEESRFYIKEQYIVLSPKTLKSYTESVKSLVHEVRHQFQMACAFSIKNDVDPFLVNLWRSEFIKESEPVNPNSEESLLHYYGLAIEVDAHAFSKWYLKEKLDIETHFPNPEYDGLIDLYIKKYIKNFK